MAYEQRDNSGAMFRNDKGDNAARPDYKGKLRVEGKDYRISGWVKTAQSSGEKFMSLAVDPDEARPADPQPEGDEEAGTDGLPF